MPRLLFTFNFLHLYLSPQNGIMEKDCSELEELFHQIMTSMKV